MKKNIKQIVAIVSLVAIVILIILFFISAFFAKPGSGNIIFALIFSIIAIPIRAWLFLFCYGRFKGEHTMAELFPKNYDSDSKDISLKNPDGQSFTEEEITQAMESSKK